MATGEPFIYRPLALSVDYILRWVHRISTILTPRLFYIQQWFNVSIAFSYVGGDREVDSRFGAIIKLNWP